MYLLMTIDTEEDMPKWKPEPVTTVANIDRLPGFNQRCREAGIRPTYLTDRPIIEHDASRDVMAGLLESSVCEIGMHLHSWNTPPVTPAEEAGAATVLNHHPPALQKEKIENLHAYFQERLGITPTSYRAGRYGLTTETIDVLAELGYLVDSSVAPEMDYSGYGAPNFRAFGREPFWIAAHPDLLEVPISIALATRLPKAATRHYHDLPDKLRIKGILHRLNLARLLWLRPSTYSEAEMRQLADFIRREDAVPVFNFMFHSSELHPGGSPYNRTEAEVEAFMDRLFSVARYLIGNLGATALTLSEFAGAAGEDRGRYPVQPLTI